MSTRKHRAATVPREISLTANQIDMPLVRRVAVIHSQQASRISWHAHRDYEMLFLSEGTTSYELQGGRTIELPGGHFLVVPPGMRHRGLYDVRHPVRLCGIMLNPHAKGALLKTPFTRENLEWMSQQCAAGALQVCRMNTELRRLVRTLSQLMLATPKLKPPGSSRDPLTAPVLRLNLCSILLEGARQLTLRRISRTSQTVEAARAYMEQHLRERISMDDVTAAANCSRAKLFLVFKESTGITPNHFLLRLRLKQAQLELSQTSRSITTIAFNCGFSTSQYFSMVFRKYTGFTPLSFRKQQQTASSESI